MYIPTTVRFVNTFKHLIIYKFYKGIKSTKSFAKNMTCNLVLSKWVWLEVPVW